MPARAGIAKGRSRNVHGGSLERVGEGGRNHAARGSCAGGPRGHGPRRPAAPSPAAIAAADKILGVIGLKQSIAIVVPGMMAELETNVTRTRPEIRDSLRATLRVDPTRIRSDREADLRPGGDSARLGNVREGHHRRRGLL